MSGCTRQAVARGLCHQHYDGHRRKRPGWHRYRPDPEGELQAPWCECQTPVWISCAPFFPTVRACAICGSPDRAQLGLPPPSPASGWRSDE